MKRSLLVLVLLLAVSAPALAATTSFAPVLLSPGERLVLSARADDTDWRPVETEIVNPCLLVRFEIRDLAGNVVASSPQAVAIDPGEGVDFAVSHADVAEGILPDMFVGLVETVPLEQPVESNGKIVPRFSLQVADAAGARIFAEKALAKAKPGKLARQLGFAPVLLAPGQSVNLAAFNAPAEKAGGVEPCFLVGFRLVALDGTLLAETQVPLLVDPGEGGSASFTFEELFGSANLPELVVALADVRPVELPEEQAGVVVPCMSLQVASAGGVEIYAER